MAIPKCFKGEWQLEDVDGDQLKKEEYLHKSEEASPRFNLLPAPKREVNHQKAEKDAKQNCQLHERKQHKAVRNEEQNCDHVNFPVFATEEGVQ